MGLVKRDYVDGVTVITAQNLNDIQDAIITDAETMGELRNALEREQTGRPLYFTSGYYVIGAVGTTVNIDNAPSSSSDYAVAVGTCIPGDVLYINAFGGSSARTYGFLDSSKQVLSRSASSAALYGWEITAPENAAYVVVNTQIAPNSTPLAYCAYIGTPTNVEIKRIIPATFTHAQKVALLDIVNAVAFAAPEKGEAAADALQAAIGYTEINPGSAWNVGKGINPNTGSITTSAYNATTTSDDWYYAVENCPTIYFDGDLYDEADRPFVVGLYEYDSGKSLKRLEYLVVNSGNTRARNPVRVKPDCSYIRFGFSYLSTSGASMTQSEIDAHFRASIEPGVN